MSVEPITPARTRGLGLALLIPASLILAAPMRGSRWLDPQAWCGRYFGAALGNEGDDYAGLSYAALQERATRISHGNLARLASGRGEENLAKICRKIAADETRHEVFYTKMVAELFERDPEATLFADRGMLRRLIEMPGSRMTDGREPDLFDHDAATRSVPASTRPANTPPSSVI